MRKSILLLMISLISSMSIVSISLAQGLPHQSRMQATKPANMNECTQKAAEKCNYLGNGTPGYNACIAVEIHICTNG